MLKAGVIRKHFIVGAVRAFGVFLKMPGLKGVCRELWLVGEDSPLMIGSKRHMNQVKKAYF